MNKKLVFYLVKRYLRFDKSQPFITVTAILAFLGVMLGVTVLMTAMAIMNGFDKEFERKLFIMNYPLTLYSRAGAGVPESVVSELEKKFPQLIFSPYYFTSAIVKNERQMLGSIVYGVDFEKEKKINEVVAKGLESKNITGFQALIGEELKKSLYLSEDNKILLIFTTPEASGLAITPAMKRFEIGATFSSGLIAYDKAYIYVTLDALKKAAKKEEGVYDGVHIHSNTPMKDIIELKKSIPYDTTVIGWWEQNGNFFAALAMEKRALFIVLMLIILIASLNIISSLLMTVMNRRKEIALMLSLGVSKGEIKQIFFYQGLVIGLIGVFMGTILGICAIYVLGSFEIISLPSDVYGTSKLPVELSTIDFVSVVLGAIVLVTLSSFYPAKKASEIDVISTLRNE